VGRRRATFVGHALLLRSIGIRARRGKFAPRVAAGQRSSVMPFSFDLSESAPRRGKSVPWVVAGQCSSIMPFSFDLSESAPGAGNSPRGSLPGSVRRSCPSPSIYRNPRPAREIRPAGRRRAAFVGHALLLRSIGIRVRRGKSVPLVAAGQRSSIISFSFDLSESVSGAGNPSRGSPPGSVRRSCPSPSIYRNPRPAREIRPAGRRRAAFVDHFVLLRFIGIRVRRGESVPRVAAGQRSSVMPFSFDLSESVSGAGNPSRGSSSENAAGQRSSIISFSFDLSESASGAGNSPRGSSPGSVRRSWHSPRSAVQKVISIEKFRRAARKTCFSPDEIYVSRLKYTCFKGGCLYWRTHWKRTLPRAMYQGI